MEEVLAQIIVQFDLTAISNGEAKRTVQHLAKSLGGSGGVLHPDATDPEMQSFYHLEIPDAEFAPGALEKIRENRSVVAAYLKPATELP